MGPTDYERGAYITGILAFLGLWGYAVMTYGWFLGLGLGWIPAAFIAVIIGLLWPFVLLVVLVAVGVIANTQQQNRAAMQRYDDSVAVTALRATDSVRRVDSITVVECEYPRYAANERAPDSDSLTANYCASFWSLNGDPAAYFLGRYGSNPVMWMPVQAAHGGTSR